MSFAALVAIEQIVAHIGQRHPGFPVEFSMALRLAKLLSWHVDKTGNAVLKAWGITFAEYSVLVLLYGRTGHTMSVREMSSVIGEASSDTSRRVLLLHNRGLVMRRHDEADRRKVVVTLCDAGAQLLQDVLPVVSELTHELVRSFAPGELAELARLLKQSLKGMV
jgi:DNA-binding MarR family transcriptional regulator